MERTKSEIVLDIANKKRNTPPCFARRVMATATTIPTAPQNSSYKGVLRGLRKDSTPTLFPDVPVQRDSGPDTLLPPGSRPERVGIARLASSSPLADAKRGTEYFLLPVRSILNHCDSDRVPFAWTVNPYRGCEFGCQYCYARYTHEYMELDSADFERKIYVKQDAGPLAGRDLGMEKVQGEHIAIGTATDPYQPAEREFGTTRAILEQMATRKGLSVSITTKSNQVVRDLDLLLRIAAHSTVHVNLSITTLRPRLARMLEPRASRDAGAQWFAARVLYLMPSAQKQFLPFLYAKFPKLARRYREWFSRSNYAPESYQREISGRIAALRTKYHLGRLPIEPARPREDAPQLNLGLDFTPAAQNPQRLTDARSPQSPLRVLTNEGS